MLKICKISRVTFFFSLHGKTNQKTKTAATPAVCTMLTTFLLEVRVIFNNFSPRWRWIVVDIFLAVSRLGKYRSTTFTYTERNNCFSIYQTSWITWGPKSNFICDNIPAKAILFFFGCLEVNSTCTWLITSELANQCVQKVLFTCVVYTNY